MVKRFDLRLRQAVTFSIRIFSAKSPAISKAVSLEHGDYCFQVSRDIRREVIDARVVNPASRVFDVIRIITEPAQPQQVVQELISYSRQRKPEEDSEND